MRASAGKIYHLADLDCETKRAWALVAIAARVVLHVPLQAGTDQQVTHLNLCAVHLNNETAKSWEECNRCLVELGAFCDYYDIDIVYGDFNQATAIRHGDQHALCRHYSNTFIPRAPNEMLWARYANPEDPDCCGFLIRRSSTMNKVRVHRDKPVCLSNEYVGIRNKDTGAHVPNLLTLRHVLTASGMRSNQPKRQRRVSGADEPDEPDDPVVPLDPAGPNVNPSSSSGTQLPVDPGSYNRGVWRTSGQDDHATAAPRFSAPPLPPPLSPLLITAESANSETMWAALDAVASHNSSAQNAAVATEC